MNWRVNVSASSADGWVSSELGRALLMLPNNTDRRRALTLVGMFWCRLCYAVLKQLRWTWENAPLLSAVRDKP
jgi:hypothetical protein